MGLKEVLEELVPINCKYNFKVEDNGRCYSQNCMMNQDPVIATRIKNEGCIIFKKINKRNTNE